jgi:hypothetical protein
MFFLLNDVRSLTLCFETRTLDILRKRWTMISRWRLHRQDALVLRGSRFPVTVPSRTLLSVSHSPCASTGFNDDFDPDMTNDLPNSFKAGNLSIDAQKGRITVGGLFQTRSVHHAIYLCRISIDKSLASDLRTTGMFTLPTHAMMSLTAVNSSWMSTVFGTTLGTFVHTFALYLADHIPGNQRDRPISMFPAGPLETDTKPAP